jgi:hypothetical protein
LVIALTATLEGDDPTGRCSTHSRAQDIGGSRAIIANRSGVLLGIEHDELG